MTCVGRHAASAAALLLSVPFVLSPRALEAATLTGTVQDRAKAPINGARISLWIPDTATRVEAISAGGRYEFRSLNEADYLIKAEKRGMALLLGAVHLKTSERHELNLVMVAGDRSGSRALVAAEDPNGTPQPAKVTGRVEPSRIQHQVSPDLRVVPDVRSTNEALFQGISVAALIHRDGTPDNLIVLYAGNEEAAMRTLLAVRQWRYTPTCLDGEPVEVSTIIDVRFEPR